MNEDDDMGHDQVLGEAIEQLHGFNPLKEERVNDYSELPHISEKEAARILLQKTTGLKMDEHGAKTPERFVKMLRELTTPEPFDFTVFPNNEGVNEIVVVRDIPFVSVCNHHVVPFVGVAHVGYVPDQKIVGLSKLARVVRHFARRLQVQERLTQDVANYLMEQLCPLGVAVVMEAEHMCMTIRGVQTPGTRTLTSAMCGVFADHERTAKREFMGLIGK
jgi:GTP cyclohydrolase I